MRERRVVMAPEVLEVVRHLALAPKRKVHAALQELARDPNLGEPLHRELSGNWRVKVRDLRIVYRFRADRVDVIAVGPRETIYTDLEREARATNSGR